MPTCWVPIAWRPATWCWRSAPVGLHSNGYSLVRKVIGSAGWQLDRHVDESGKTLGEELLTPTRVYSADLLDLIRTDGIDVSRAVPRDRWWSGREPRAGPPAHRLRPARPLDLDPAGGLLDHRLVSARCRGPTSNARSTWVSASSRCSNTPQAYIGSRQGHTRVQTGEGVPVNTGRGYTGERFGPSIPNRRRGMTETPTHHGYIQRKDDYARRLRRIEGQARGLQRMVEEEKYCIDILTQISAITKALQSVGLGLLDEHLRHCVVDAASADGRAAEVKLQEASDVIARLVRS